MLKSSEAATQQSFSSFLARVMVRLVPAWVFSLRCALARGGHAYGCWWWPDRPEAAHQICDECAALRTPKQRGVWLLRERQMAGGAIHR